MTITKAPKLTPQSFISKAPDAAPVRVLATPAAPPAPAAGEGAEEDMTQITLRISKDDLAKIDAEAKRRRISRAGYLRLAAFDLMGR